MENKINTISFKEYQDKVLELYEKIYTIFDILNLKWWVHSGTLLGIIRHDNKMIPWDDDIDMMTTFKIWGQYKETIKNELLNNEIFTFDFLNDLNSLSSFPFVKFVSKDKFYVNYEGNKTTDPVRPFVDLFFACPSNEFSNKEWKRIKKFNETKWIFGKGFDRCLNFQNSPIKKHLMNISTLPIKLFFSDDKLTKYKNRAINSDENWNIVRRFDKWSNRKNSWDLINGIKKTIINDKIAYISTNYVLELTEEFGEGWYSEKVNKSHIFTNQNNFKRDIFINRFIDNTYNK